ncbi:hypothetical protein MPL1032_130051 [Mesorhizobium plurifarium]|uniref:Uncharacterized protein n=1 Tax=Mesorhizobium plurifarium TaxID=69974 RepID=A0A0K2VQ63_MESPL|nr:hypothetical protein MPL1032_130051 [Mesorhizobium plurifarium]
MTDSMASSRRFMKGSGRVAIEVISARQARFSRQKTPPGRGPGGAQYVPLESGQGRERPVGNLGVAMRQFNELAPVDRTNLLEPGKEKARPARTGLHLKR